MIARAKQRVRRGQAAKQSGYRGVCWSTVQGQWVARFTRDGRTYHVGYFDNEHAAGAALASAIVEYEADRARRARIAARGTCGVPVAGPPAPPSADAQQLQEKIETARSFLQGKVIR